jgi:hypothetical protein
VFLPSVNCNYVFENITISHINLFSIPVFLQNAYLSSVSTHFFVYVQYQNTVLCLPFFQKQPVPPVLGHADFDNTWYNNLSCSLRLLVNVQPSLPVLLTTLLPSFLSGILAYTDKNKIKLSSYIKKFRVEQLQSYIWGRASYYMRKCANISPYMRRSLVIYNFATAPFWIS